MGQTASVTEVNDNMEFPCVRVCLDARYRPSGTNRSFTLSKSNSSINVGRASTNASRPNSVQKDNCYISSPIMSREHARFIFGDKNHPLKIVDEGSTHGTFVNAVKLRKGQEMVLEDGCFVTFGSEVLNASYLPTSFMVSYMWHERQSQSSSASNISRTIIRAPSLSSDSEEDQNISDIIKHGKERSPSVIVIGSPRIIDLTGESDLSGPQVPPRHSGQPTIFDENNNMTEAALRDSEGPEEVLIIKETNLDTTGRHYQFDYPESDFEEEQDTTSQSSPPKEDFNSLYDVSDAPVATPLRWDAELNEADGKETVAERPTETSLFDDNDGSIYQEDTSPRVDPYQRIDELYERSQSAHSEESSQSERSVDYPDSSAADEDSIVDDEDDCEDERSSVMSANDKTIMTYTEALNYLGASRETNDSWIASMFTATIDRDPECEMTAWTCVKAIANHRQSDTLWTWLRNRVTTKTHFEDGDEELQSTSFPSLPVSNIDQISTGFPSFPNTYQGRSTIGNMATSMGLSNSFSYPQLPYPSSSDQTYRDRHSTTTFEDRRNVFTPSFASPYVPPIIPNESSSKMQISNILDSVPSSEPLYSEGTYKAYTLEQSELEVQPENHKIACESGSEQPHIGGKRKFDDISVSGEDEDADANVAAPLSRPAEILSSTAENLVDAFAGTQDATEIANPQSIEAEILQAIDVEERGPPPSKRARLGSSHKTQPGRFRTLATHCIAGAVGAIGVLAAIVATTPLQVQEELLYQTM